MTNRLRPASVWKSNGFELIVDPKPSNLYAYDEVKMQKTGLSSIMLSVEEWKHHGRQVKVGETSGVYYDDAPDIRRFGISQTIPIEPKKEEQPMAQSRFRSEKQWKERGFVLRPDAVQDAATNGYTAESVRVKDDDFDNVIHSGSNVHLSRDEWETFGRVVDTNDDNNRDGNYDAPKEAVFNWSSTIDKDEWTRRQLNAALDRVAG